MICNKIKVKNLSEVIYFLRLTIEIFSKIALKCYNTNSLNIYLTRSK